MQKQIFPLEILENNTEYYLNKISIRSQRIYIRVVLSVFIVLIALRFIYIDVSVKASGQVRPQNEKSEIKVLVSGKIQDLKIGNKTGHWIFILAGWFPIRAISSKKTN